MVREIGPLCFYAIIFINCPVNWTIFLVLGFVLAHFSVIPTAATMAVSAPTGVSGAMRKWLLLVQRLVIAPHVNLCKTGCQQEDSQHEHCTAAIVWALHEAVQLVGRIPQTSRGAALGPLMPLSLSLNSSPMCWRHPIQNKSWGEGEVSAHGCTRPVGSAYLCSDVLVNRSGAWEKIIKAISTLSLKCNKIVIFEYLSPVYLPEFSLAIAIVSGSNTNKKIGFYSTFYPKIPKHLIRIHQDLAEVPTWRLFNKYFWCTIFPGLQGKNLCGLPSPTRSLTYKSLHKYLR